MKYIILLFILLSTNLYAANYYQVVDFDYDTGTPICGTQSYSTKQAVCNSYKSFYLDWWLLKDIQLCPDSSKCGTIGTDEDQQQLDCDYLTLPICEPTVVEKRCFSNQKLVVKPMVGEVCECIDPDHVLTSTAQCVPKSCLNSAIPAINCLKEDVINSLNEFGDVINPALDQYDQSFKSVQVNDDDHASSTPQDNDDTENQNVNLEQLNADTPVLNKKITVYSFFFFFTKK